MLNIQERVSLKHYSVFKIGGPARYFCEIKSKNELVAALNWANSRRAPFFILGAGSNILFSDEGFRGLIIKMSLRDIGVDCMRIFAGAGVMMAHAVAFAIKNGLGGFEWGIGVPGTIGGSVFGNAGCYGSEMKDVVESVEVFDTSKTIDYKLPTTNRSFAYRHSIFKEHPEWIIVSATLKLFLRDSTASTALIREYSKKRTTTQDIGSLCAGCIFKNFTQSDGVAKISAGQLIDTAGLKGMRVGGAIVSEKHANFIVNTDNATARDVRQLIALIKEKVKKIHGVELEEEIRYIG